MNVWQWLLIGIAGGLLVMAVVSETEFSQSQSSTTTTTTSAQASRPAGARALVDGLGVRIEESLPVRVSVILRGSVPDGCTRISEVDLQRDGNAFEIDLRTERDADAVCTQALQRFEETVLLDAEGLDPGNYVVRAGPLKASFELTLEQKQPEGEGTGSD